MKIPRIGGLKTIALLDQYPRQCWRSPEIARAPHHDNRMTAGPQREHALLMSEIEKLHSRQQKLHDKQDESLND
jgi:hypothetical protein